MQLQAYTAQDNVKMECLVYCIENDGGHYIWCYRLKKFDRLQCYSFVWSCVAPKLVLNRVLCLAPLSINSLAWPDLF